jgi:hypothetical protein
MTGVPQIEIKESISDLRELMKKQKSGLGFAKVQTFFSVKPRGDAIIVTLNTNHSAYQNLVEILEEDVDKTDMDTLRSGSIPKLR